MNAKKTISTIAAGALGALVLTASPAFATPASAAIQPNAKGKVAAKKVSKSTPRTAVKANTPTSTTATPTVGFHPNTDVTRTVARRSSSPTPPVAQVPTLAGNATTDITASTGASAGSWSFPAYSFYYGGTAALASGNGATWSTYAPAGSTVLLKGTTYTGGADVEVLLDGALNTSASSYRATTPAQPYNQPLVQVSIPGDGKAHLLTFRSKVVRSTATTLALDSIVVTGGGSTPITPPPTTGSNDFTGWSQADIAIFQAFNADRGAKGLPAATTGPACLHAFSVTQAQALVAAMNGGASFGRASGSLPQSVPASCVSGTSSTVGYGQGATTYAGWLANGLDAYVSYPGQLYLAPGAYSYGRAISIVTH